MRRNTKKRRRKTDLCIGIGVEEEEEAYVPIPLEEIIEDFLVSTRRLLVVGDINEISATHICSYLQLFSLLNQPVYMYIHSSGGCLASGYAIIDQMLACSCPIYTIVRGQAYSMGAIIAAFGTKGCRFATPNASLMLHSLILQPTSDSIERHRQMTKYLETDYQHKITNLAKQLKITRKQLLSLMQETRWMSAKQAIQIGLIDGIWTPQMERLINKGT
jgi:ATP-dependent Clp protease protease subunit